MSEHAFVQENLAGYVADGLTAQERERFDRHVHGCGDCHRLLAEQRAFDDSLGKLFASARPAAGFENRVIAGLLVLAILFAMAGFATLLRKVGPHEALIVSILQRQPTIGRQRAIELGDLVALGKIRIEIVLPGEDRLGLDLAA